MSQFNTQISRKHDAISRTDCAILKQIAAISHANAAISKKNVAISHANSNGNVSIFNTKWWFDFYTKYYKKSCLFFNKNRG